jgi:hypothetical protein
MLGTAHNVAAYGPAGGFKLWEGAVDLCNFLIQQYQLTGDSLGSSSSSSSGQEPSLRVSTPGFQPSYSSTCE